MRYWYKPKMPVWDFCEPLIKAPHVLIAGATGSGKNVFLDNMIFSLMGSATPGDAQFVLIDPKRVELVKYKKTPFCVRYASEKSDIVSSLDMVLREMERRYREMQKEGKTLYEGPALYLIIDELADLMITIKKAVLPRLQDIAQLGRSAKIHIWAASQSPSRLTIPAELTLNFVCKIALRCDSAIESRQVVGKPGAELLPMHGECLIKIPGEVYKQTVPVTPKEDLDARIAFWRKSKPKFTWRKI